jgi:hypothetical protein
MLSAPTWACSAACRCASVGGSGLADVDVGAGDELAGGGLVDDPLADAGGPLDRGPLVEGPAVLERALDVVSPVGPVPVPAVVLVQAASSPAASAPAAIHLRMPTSSPSLRSPRPVQIIASRAEGRATGSGRGGRRRGCLGFLSDRRG